MWVTNSIPTGCGCQQRAPRSGSAGTQPGPAGIPGTRVPRQLPHTAAAPVGAEPLCPPSSLLFSYFFFIFLIFPSIHFPDGKRSRPSPSPSPGFSARRSGWLLSTERAAPPRYWGDTGRYWGGGTGTWGFRRGYSHAAAGGNLPPVAEPSDLGLGEAGDAGRSDDSRLTVGHALLRLAVLEAPHVCGAEGTAAWGRGRIRPRSRLEATGMGSQRGGEDPRGSALPSQAPKLLPRARGCPRPRSHPRRPHSSSSPSPRRGWGQ